LFVHLNEFCKRSKTQTISVYLRILKCNIFDSLNKNTLEKVTKEIIQNLILNIEIEFNSTQTKLCLPIIDRIYRKMLVGIKFSAIKVDDNLICDGHHRYLASLLANITIEKVPTNSTSATTNIDWESVIFEEEDWDTLAKINMLNWQDAEYNNIAIEKIVELLK
jgi:hypothetical protein